MEPVVINESGLSLEEIGQLRSMGFEVAEQGSDEWLEERLGKATASRFIDVVDHGVSGTKPKAGYYNYMNELVAERLTGKAKRFSSKPMDWGKSHEAEAAAIYEDMTGFELFECGLYLIPDMAAGASPDRLVGDDGLLEVKCPNSTTHIDYVLNGAPDKYIAQMQGQMWATGRKWCDFMSYDPEMPENLRVYIERIERDDDYIKTMNDRVVAFLALVDEREAYLRERME